jgi:hypothetical protein
MLRTFEIFSRFHGEVAFRANHKQLTHFSCLQRLNRLSATTVGGNFKLTENGMRFFKFNRSERLAELARLVTRMPVFRDVAIAWIRREHLSVKEIARSLKRHFGFSESTAERRAVTVRSWIQWLADQLGS